MRRKNFLSILMIFFVAITSGCGGAAVKSAFKSAGKGVSNTAKKVMRNADKIDTAMDIADVALNSRSGNNNPGVNRSPVNRNATRAGAVVAGGAFVASELLTGALDSRDLSLGEFAIDDREEKVTAKLGRPSSVSTDSDGGRRLTFKDIEIVVRQGKISALVSMSSAYATARGIHEGSPAQEIFDKYGTDCEKTVYDNQTLYEYQIKSADGHPCWLRFAINSSTNKVEYISVRFVQSESQNGGDNGDSAKQAFINYHKAITNKNYRAAYETFSHNQREAMGSFDSYVSGFSDTISSEVTDIKLVSSDENSCTFDYTLTARDRYQGNRIKVQIFKGQVVMIKDSGNWYIRQSQASKVNEKYE